MVCWHIWMVFLFEKKKSVFYGSMENPTKCKPVAIDEVEVAVGGRLSDRVFLRGTYNV